VIAVWVGDDGRVTIREVDDEAAAYALRIGVPAFVGRELPDEYAAVRARGDVDAIAALSVSALTLALPELTLYQLEALLLVEGHTRGRRDALAAISAEIRGRA